MAFAHLPNLIETRVTSAIDAESWTSGVTVAASTGAEIITFPAIIVAVEKGSEEPEHSGNYRCDLTITVLGKVDPDNDSTFASAVSAHESIAGNVANWISSDTDAAASALSGTITGFTNELVIQSLRLDAFTRDINPAEGAFEDSFAIELYAHMDA